MKIMINNDTNKIIDNLSYISERANNRLGDNQPKTTFMLEISCNDIPANFSIKDKLDIIKNDYDNKKSSSTYEFLLEEEKENVLKDYLVSLDKLIKFIEDNTNYKYGIDYLISIKID